MMTLQTIPKPIRYRYDIDPPEEELMGNSVLHQKEIHYLIDLLKYLFRLEGWLIADNLNLYWTDDENQRPLTPDVSVFKGVALTEEQENELVSWRVLPPYAPPPAVVFEVAPASSVRRDQKEKPQEYGALGVREYYYADPRRGKRPTLRGWRNAGGQMEELPSDSRRRIWSQELRSWLALEGVWLRLYDVRGEQRLTAEEAERAARETAEREREEAEKELNVLRARLKALGIDSGTGGEGV